MYTSSHCVSSYVFSVSGFEFTCESGLFDLLDVALYHGWVVDPQDEVTYNVVSCYSYNQLAEMVISKSNSEDEIERRNGNYINCIPSPGHQLLCV